MHSEFPVVLVSMPFMDIDKPSIQLGLLKSIVQSNRFPVATLHANLEFAARIGADRYARLAQQRRRLVGDWLFSVAAFGDAAPDPEARFVEDFDADLADLGDLRRVRDHDVPAYLDALLDEVPGEQTRVVGFSSTFQQSAASFAFARRLKARWPHLVTVFGGANFDGEMGLELTRTVDCVDYAVIGEGDVAFPRLLHALAAEEDPGGIPGVAYRWAGGVVQTPPAPALEALDGSPVPDYDEYFTRAERTGLLPVSSHRRLWIPFESARGCWWGEKHHCTFCGLNGATMRFRAKSPERVQAELGQLATRYRSFRFAAVDNIMETGYLKTLLPRLAAERSDYELFYEVKANLSRAQLKLLAEAGMRHIQPGLESLSSNVLRLMRKGIRAAQNVNLLRWARYYGIDAAWNILWGFPGETEEDYAEQAALVPNLVHLQPPASAARIWLERFSPLFAETDVRPEASYSYVYPRETRLERVAYFFEDTGAPALPDGAYKPLREAVDGWIEVAPEQPALTMWSAPDFVQIYDGRRSGAEGTYTFEGPLARIYLACVDRPRTAAAVRDGLGEGVAEEFVAEAFAEFGRRGLMMLDGNLAVALALPAVSGR